MRKNTSPRGKRALREALWGIIGICNVTSGGFTPDIRRIAETRLRLGKLPESNRSKKQ